ncbi:protein NSP-INTERACTING KINASE 3 isoform X2 [Capsicum annuum]|uniref:protein NSP-INTERACTING KINASE 3 isoform X2 n=1 Tax=Capsicum annuum TaxID=4072 RepID=UPI0007BECD6A|nr:protein NSP-INTERACTING KINASE 3 isoform X2 [Capsicum annuum]
MLYLFWNVGLLLLCILMESSCATLSPAGVNYEVVALTEIKKALHDPYNVLDNWDVNSVDPCSWRMVTCSFDGYVSALALPSQSLSGTLSPGIGNLTNLQYVLLQNNAISGHIPDVIGKLQTLQTIDLSNNKFEGKIPTSFEDLKNLNYLDVSYNNLSGTLPKISARAFKVLGNPLICGQGSENNCSAVYPEPLSFPPDSLADQPGAARKSHRMVVAFVASFSAAFLFIVAIALLLWWRYRHNQQIFFDVNDSIYGKPVLDWSRRKKIAKGTARGLVYLHEQCDPKIIHRDVKAANILLDEEFEAVVGDFGLAKLLDHRDSHVTTAVRGTIGHIAPEYLSTGQSSEKTDVFGFGILLLELITGQKAMDFGRGANKKGVVMLDWVRKLHQEEKLNLIVDKDLKNNFDRIELEEMVKVALLCTHFNPSHRPKMSEALRMLEGDGFAEKWEASQKLETPRNRAFEHAPQRYSNYVEESSLVEPMELSGPR